MAEQNGKHRVDKGAKAGRAGEPAPAKFPGEQPENEDPDPVVITGTHDSAMSEVSPGAADTPAAPAPEIIEDPVEILVGLAERGEIDPWNINIIEVTDRFLSELERCRRAQPPDIRAHPLLCGNSPAHEVRTAGPCVR